MADNRLLGADFLRASACMIVVGHHLSQRMSWDHSLGYMEWLRFFTQIGGFGVAIFFVLSGFLLSRPFWQALDRGEPMPSLRTYALRRAARILPGFWLALSVTFILTLTIPWAHFTSELLLRYIAGLLLVADWHWITFFPVEVNGPLWSISFEVTSYVLLPFGLMAMFALGGWIGRGWQRRLAWLGIIALALAAHFAFTHLVIPGPLRRGWDYGLVGGAKLWMPLFNPFGFFAMFAVGALAGGLQVRLAAFRNWLFDALSLLGLAGAGWLLYVQSFRSGTEAYGFLGVPYAFPYLQLTIGFLLVVTPSSVVVGQMLDNRVVRFIARISFGIYVWHYVVLELVRHFFVPEIDMGRMADPTLLAQTAELIMGVTIAIATASYYLLEAPLIRWARGLEQRRGTGGLSVAAG